MPRAVRPLFAAAALLLLGAVVVLGIRSTGDGGTPSAIQTEDAPDDGDGAVTPDAAAPSPGDTGTPEAPDETASPDATEPDVTPDGTDTGDDGDATTGDDGDATTGDDGTGTDDGRTGTGTGGRTGGEGADRPIDDMPDTGGGAATALGGLVALGAAAGIARRR